MNEYDSKVYLTHEQREMLALTMDVFAAALREHRELRVGDFQDIIAEVRHFQQSPAPCHPGLDIAWIAVERCMSRDAMSALQRLAT